MLLNQLRKGCLPTALALSCFLSQGCSAPAEGSAPLAPPPPHVHEDLGPELAVNPADMGDNGDDPLYRESEEKARLNQGRESEEDFLRSLVEPLGVPTPTTGTVEQPRGEYANGSLVNASAIPFEGDGYVKIFRDRARQYGSLDIVSLFQAAAYQMKLKYSSGERLQIGDIANKGGGTAGGHASHQNGLDMDVVYFRVDKNEVLNSDTFVESFVKNGKVTSNFDTARNWDLLKYIVSTGRVNRIFMDQAIKKEFCRYSRATGEIVTKTEVLRRMRPWPNHDNHFHLRITCPKKSPKCVAQPEPDAGSGC